jgi:hypothetical protein
MAMSGQFQLAAGGQMQLAAHTQSTGLDNSSRADVSGTVRGSCACLDGATRRSPPTITCMDRADPGTGTQQTTDPRAEALRNRLNDALLEVENGEYFRSRVHGWVAYRDDADVQLPEPVASRLTTPFSFARPENVADVSTLDAFVLAYHAAESLCRQILALLEGGGPSGLRLIALSELKAGTAFNDRLARLAGLRDADLCELLDYLFLPTEIQETWPDDLPKDRERPGVSAALGPLPGWLHRRMAQPVQRREARASGRSPPNTVQLRHRRRDPAAGPNLHRSRRGGLIGV